MICSFCSPILLQVLKGSNSGYLTRAISTLHINTLTIITVLLCIEYSKRGTRLQSTTILVLQDAILLDGQPNVSFAQRKLAGHAIKWIGWERCIDDPEEGRKILGGWVRKGNWRNMIAGRGVVAALSCLPCNGDMGASFLDYGGPIIACYLELRETILTDCHHKLTLSVPENCAWKYP